MIDSKNGEDLRINVNLHIYKINVKLTFAALLLSYPIATPFHVSVT